MNYVTMIGNKEIGQAVFSYYAFLSSSGKTHEGQLMISYDSKFACKLNINNITAQQATFKEV